MKRESLWFGVMVVLILAPLANGTRAAGADAPKPPEGFEAVFNGRDLTGWEGSPQFWSVEDGCLTGTADGTLKYNRFITWRGGTLKNFELRVKVKVTPGGNSGLQYRGTERPDLGESVVTGYQCDVVANRPDYNGMLYEERGRRILAHTGERVVIDESGQPWVVGEFPVQAFPAGQWHDYRVLAEGNHYRHWIDGVPTVDVIDLDAKGRKLEGVLAVQVHVGPPMKIQYRDFFLKRLPDDLPLVAGDQAKIPPDARKVVPQGKDKPRAPGGEGAAAQGNPKPKPMNVILILADDLGWADITCQGADVHETPNIDRLAAEGLRFTHAYAASVCSPTRASLMTGKHPARLGITIWREAAHTPPPPGKRKLIPPEAVADLPLSEVTLAEILHAEGYLTALVGKWHLGDATHYPETQGFDINIGGTIWGAPQTFFYPYRGSGAFGNEYRYVPHLELGKPGEYLTDRLTDEALRVIDAAVARDQPFFVEIAHHAPHTPIEAKPKLLAYYEQKVTANPAAATHHRNVAYAAMVHSLDENVGRVLQRLDERGLADRTVVVFTSDNGGYINEYNKQRVTDNYPLRSGKGSLYEGGIRVPMIIRWPGVTPRGAVCAKPVQVMDLYPTLRDSLAPGEGPRADTLDSLSLAPLLRDLSTHLSRDALFFHYPHYYATTTPVSAIRAGDWKLLEYFDDNHVELYNLADDPRESRDLAAARPDTAESLRQRLQAWRQSVAARLPAPNPDFRPPRGR
jgi:arylsulfatase A-like enzyme